MFRAVNEITGRTVTTTVDWMQLRALVIFYEDCFTPARWTLYEGSEYAGKLVNGAMYAA